MLAHSFPTRRSSDLLVIDPNTAPVVEYIYSMAEEGLGLHRSEEHTSELQSLPPISYAVFCFYFSDHFPVLLLISSRKEVTPLDLTGSVFGVHFIDDVSERGNIHLRLLVGIITAAFLAGAGAAADVLTGAALASPAPNSSTATS